MASLTSSNNYISALVGASADAQANLFLVTFTSTQGVFANKNLREHFQVRVDGFEPPEVSQDKYDVKFVNATIPRPTAKVNVTRNFSLTFRTDANYEVYQALLEQQKITFSPTHGYATNDILAQSDKLFSVDVDVINEGVINEAPETTRLYRFRNCWISKIDPLNFEVGSSNPQKVNVTINFLQMDDRLSSGAISAE